MNQTVLETFFIKGKWILLFFLFNWKNLNLRRPQKLRDTDEWRHADGAAPDQTGLLPGFDTMNRCFRMKTNELKLLQNIQLSHVTSQFSAQKRDFITDRRLFFRSFLHFSVEQLLLFTGFWGQVQCEFACKSAETRVTALLVFLAVNGVPFWIKEGTRPSAHVPKYRRNHSTH